MKATLLPTARDEVVQAVLFLNAMIEEDAPPEALVEVGGHLADLLSKHSVRESNPQAYMELRDLIVEVFRLAADKLRADGHAPADIVDDIDESLDRTRLVLTLAAASSRGEAA